MLINIHNVLPSNITPDDPIVSGFQKQIECIAKEAGGSILSFHYSDGDALLEVDDCASPAVWEYLEKMVYVKEMLGF